MRAYDALHVFPDVPAGFRALRDQAEPAAVAAAGAGSRPRVEAYVFSNGTADMISSSLANSPDLAPYVGGVLRSLVSVDEIRLYKPDRRAYEHLLRRVGKEGRPEQVWLVSSNPFDVVGAVSAGLKAAWVDRAAKGWTDRLLFEPTIVVRGVDEAVREIINRAAE